MSTILVRLEVIHDNPYQTRLDYGDVAALAADIAARGLLQQPMGRLVWAASGLPLNAGQTANVLRNYEVQGWQHGLRVELAFGHRRLRAYRQLAGETHMPVRIASLSNDDMLDALWTENAQRVDVNPMEQAELMVRKLELAKQQGGGVQTVATDWGLDRSTVANKLRLLKLPPKVQQAVRDGRVSERQAMAILSALQQGDEAATPVIEAALDDPRAVSSDKLRRLTYAPRVKAARLPKSDVPMLRHGIRGDQSPDTVAWATVIAAARGACERCVRTVGPANELVCRQCPGVTLIQALGAT